MCIRDRFKGDYMKFNESIIKGDKARSNGVSAMSVSDMTGIPRATVIRKCKFLIKNNYLKLNEKKQYILTGFNVQRVLPYQRLIFKNTYNNDTKTCEVGHEHNQEIILLMQEYCQDVLTWITDMQYSTVANTDQKMDLIVSDFFSEFLLCGMTLIL